MILLTGLYVWLAWKQGLLLFLPAGAPAGLTNQPRSAEASATVTPTYNPLPTQPLANQATSAPPPEFMASLRQGLVVLAFDEGGYTHLFAFQPGEQPFKRLTNGPWRDITPAISPDGSRLAFASNRDGSFDLYLLELTSGEISRLTDTPQYEASPSWSPDGLWLAYESYIDNPQSGGDLEIFIKPIDDSVEPIQLTFHPEADHSPTWSPQGRKIAFVSTRNGDSDIWLADLDAVDERFSNLSHNRDAEEYHPAWSPDGAKLTWSSLSSEGIQDIYLFDLAQPDLRPKRLNNGDWSAWSPDGAVLMTSLQTPNREYLSAFSLNQHELSLPALALSGSLAGLDWGLGHPAINLAVNPPQGLASIAQTTPTPLWQALLTPQGESPRLGLSALHDIQAPDPRLQDSVDESFNALRQRVAYEAGWDLLSNLEQASKSIFCGDTRLQKHSICYNAANSSQTNFTNWHDHRTEFFPFGYSGH